MESGNQRMFVRALNLTGLGFFYRVKNMGTFDPVRKRFRKDHGTALVAIPDICGYVFQRRTAGLKDAIPVYIEVKYVEKVENKKKLIFSVDASDLQKRFLCEAHRAGCRAGIAFTLDDCLAIAYNDHVRYPRHPRTWAFLPPPEIELKAQEYEAQKKALAKLKQDPLARDVFLANATVEPEEDWEKL